jgi:hypothetical protein
MIVAVAGIYQIWPIHTGFEEVASRLADRHPGHRLKTP